MSDLHAKIMNLQCNEPDLNRTSVAPAYRLGHRDARHAAAELAAMEAHRIEALEAELQRARSEARHAMADGYRLGREVQAAAIDAALAQLDASLITNAVHQRAKDILRAAREATK